MKMHEVAFAKPLFWKTCVSKDTQLRGESCIWPSVVIIQCGSVKHEVQYLLSFGHDSQSKPMSAFQLSSFVIGLQQKYSSPTYLKSCTPV